MAGLAMVGLLGAFGVSHTNAATAALCTLGAVLAATALAAGTPPDTLTLPIGLPGAGTTLALDPLGALFLLLLFTLAAAAAVFAIRPHAPEHARTLGAFPVFVAAMALTLLAADGWSLVFGFELMSLASWALVLARHEDPATRDAALLYLGMAAFGAACLVPAFAILAPAAEPLDLHFAAIRAAPPAGWHATLVLALVLLGAGSKAGLAPLHVWLPLAHPVAPSHVSALMSGAMTKVALYVVIRVLFDLCGPATPGWWGVPLLATGAASAVLGALRANTEADLKTILAASTIENIGLIAIGLGVALLARAADLTPLAALALAAALLHTLGHGVFKTMLFLAAGAAQHGAGSRMLSRLGGLIRGMPVTTACVLVGAAALAALPPSSGFASEWLLFQALLAAPRIGGLGLQTTVTVVAALAALAAGLAAAAAVRLVGVAFLGRPRSPRAAAATEADRPALAAMLGLAGATLLLGLLPGPALGLIEPVLHRLLGQGMADRAGLLAVAPTLETPGYAAPAIAALLALAAVATLLVLRRFARRGSRRAPAWDGGYAAPPPWLPFGDPATQYGAASFSEPLRRILGGTLLGAQARVTMPDPGDPAPARLDVTAADPAAAGLFAPVARLRNWLSGQADRLQFLTIRSTLSVMFAALVLFLAVIGWLEQR